MLLIINIIDIININILIISIKSIILKMKQIASLSNQYSTYFTLITEKRSVYSFNWLACFVPCF